ncbi:1,4-dihydroxy-2-naphthoate polyprenyltransferase [Adhaeribacter sp. BT258]|uniref:1,4-dihydroxy-2-naphthoate octaprenyltransferase n=1 Tax=Adhaeribacter terrigena TaxID=2793070 RepID=A0ABS1C5I6_9BACT|nr:1,4-dihydroxy-2-naphthoate polyprenyltransferase [Adhaeribacter terrigena]MBK0404625.1 1,4-dihydroxy-2-naphthoate polyprenyltransferase [Adhaeribacter terrigena]
MNHNVNAEAPGKLKAWVSAFRLRTLPLALSSIFMGGFLAATQLAFDPVVLGLCILTTLFLQILSNLANDYGDSVHGADHAERKGPKRAVQAGLISAKEMKTGIVVFSLLSLVSGLGLLWFSFGSEGIYLFLLFLALGLAAIWAAITYTNGPKPYGYAGLGDISVFLFFGLVGVLGTVYLQSQEFSLSHILPAAACGFFATGVLNVNNIRDIVSDKLAGKNSVPVRLGTKNARIYHWFLLIAGMACAVGFVFWRFFGPWQFLFVLSFPFFIYNGVQVSKKQQPAELDPYLKQLSLSTLLFVFLFGIGLALSLL